MSFFEPKPKKLPFERLKKAKKSHFPSSKKLKKAQKSSKKLNSSKKPIFQAQRSSKKLKEAQRNPFPGSKKLKKALFRAQRSSKKLKGQFWAIFSFFEPKPKKLPFERLKKAKKKFEPTNPCLKVINMGIK